jgi:hypothetical protein
MAMMAMTTNSSINVKPLHRLRGLALTDSL